MLNSCSINFRAAWHAQNLMLRKNWNLQITFLVILVLHNHMDARKMWIINVIIFFWKTWLFCLYNLRIKNSYRHDTQSFWCTVKIFSLFSLIACQPLLLLIQIIFCCHYRQFQPTHFSLPHVEDNATIFLAFLPG